MPVGRKHSINPAALRDDVFTVHWFDRIPELLAHRIAGAATGLHITLNTTLQTRFFRAIQEYTQAKKMPNSSPVQHP